MNALKLFFVFLIAGIALASYEIFINYPSREEVEEKIKLILNNPSQCESSNPKITKTLRLINSRYSAIYLAEKMNAIPIRIDFYIKDEQKNTIGELTYRVDGGCQGLRITQKQ